MKEEETINEVLADLKDLLRATRPVGDIAKLDRSLSEKELLRLMLTWDNYAEKYGIIKPKKKTKAKR